MEKFQKIYIATMNIECDLGNSMKNCTKVASSSSAIVLKENVREKRTSKWMHAQTACAEVLTKLPYHKYYFRLDLYLRIKWKYESHKIYILFTLGKGSLMNVYVSNDWLYI